MSTELLNINLGRRNRTLPRPGFILNKSHPLAQGLAAAILPVLDTSTSAEYVRGGTAPSTIVGTSGVIASPFGEAGLLNTGSASRLKWGPAGTYNAPVVSGGSAASIVMIMKRDSTLAGDLRFGIWGSSALGDSQMLAWITHSSGDVNVAFMRSTGVGVTLTSAGAAANGWHIVVGTVERNSPSPLLKGYLNGILYNTVSSNNDMNVPASGVVGWGDNQAASFGGGWAMGLYYHRELRAEEVVSLQIDPFQMFDRVSQDVPVLGGGAGAPAPDTGFCGVATLDFGNFPGSNEASVAVSNSSVVVGADIEAYLMGDDTSINYTASDVRYLAALVGLTCGNATAGVGFTIYGRSLERLQGKIPVRYVWADC